MNVAQELHDLLEKHWGTAWTEGDAGLYVALMDWAARHTAALTRVTELANKWDNAIGLDTGRPSLVARAFAAELRAALDGPGQRSLDVARAAAKAAVAASKNTGRPVDPRVQKLAEE
jgi:hypothetical protein